MKYTRLDPPAFLNEFTSEDQRKDWSNIVSGFFDDGVGFNRKFSGVTSQFYHPMKTETDEPFEEPVIDWPGFPKLVKDEFPTNPEAAWRKAETGPNARKQFMDEYLEWHVIRNAQDKITRVSFTCETTQYYRFLAESDPDKLLQIYKDLVAPAFSSKVKIGDLISGGVYRPENKWNTSHGAIHLIQPNNNLFAEVMIAAQACILRCEDDGTPISDSDALIKCAGFGEPGRSSDPRIGAIVNLKASEGFSISLRNPVALYMTQWDSTGFKNPDGSPAGNYWTLRRGKPAASPGDPAMGLHLVYEVPPGKGFVIGDMKIGSKTIKFGGQLAEHINVGLFGLICREGGLNNPRFRCNEQPIAPVGVAPLGVADAGEERPPLRGARIKE